MSRSLNKVTLIGNLGADPEIRMTPSGTKIAKISIATSRSFPDRSGQTQEKTEWHRITFFGKLADIVEQYVTKGDRLYVEGRIEYSQTDDGQGNVRYWTDIVANEMIMLGGSAGGAEATWAEAAAGAVQRWRRPLRWGAAAVRPRARPEPARRRPAVLRRVHGDRLRPLGRHRVPGARCRFARARASPGRTPAGSLRVGLREPLEGGRSKAARQPLRGEPHDLVIPAVPGRGRPRRGPRPRPGGTSRRGTAQAGLPPPSRSRSPDTWPAGPGRWTGGAIVRQRPTHAGHAPSRWRDPALRRSAEKPVHAGRSLQRCRVSPPSVKRLRARRRGRVGEAGSHRRARGTGHWPVWPSIWQGPAGSSTVGRVAGSYRRRGAGLSRHSPADAGRPIDA
jgi:single-strand DNA-binding protein